MKIDISRTYKEKCTQGVLKLWEGKTLLFLAHTLELPYRDNQRKISCIPEGEYSAFKRFSPRFQIITFEVTKVPNRSAILFHPGNTVKDTEGCILVGYDALDCFVGKSRSCFKKMMKFLEPFQSIEVEINEG